MIPGHVVLHVHELLRSQDIEKVANRKLRWVLAAEENSMKTLKNVQGFTGVNDSLLLKGGLLKIPGEFCWFDGVVPRQCRLKTVCGSWKVDVKKIKKEVFLEKGWDKFVGDNSLKQGEHLVLQYVGVAKFLVEIYGHNHCERSMGGDISLNTASDEDDVIIIDSESDSEVEDSEMSSASEGDLVRGRKASRRGKVRNAATINSSGNHCFSIRMCQSHLKSGPLLTPRSFLRNIFKPGKVKLQVGNKCWEVNWIHPYGKSSRFSGGWLPFLNENELKEGDMCEFELISKEMETAVMNVTIKRKQCLN